MSATNGPQPQDLNRIVLDYLAKKGYSRTEAMLRLEASGSGVSVEEKLKSIEETPDAYTHTYTILRDWVDSSLELYKAELHRILFPIFVHSYLNLLSQDHYEAGKLVILEEVTNLLHVCFDDLRTRGVFELF